MTPHAHQPPAPQVVAWTRYGPMGASSRLRFGQYVAAWRHSDPGFSVDTQALLDDGYLRALYARQGGLLPHVLRGYARRFAALLRRHRRPRLHWIEKELFPWAPAWLESVLLGRTPYVLDFDDAIFHHYDRHRSALVRKLYGHKIDTLMRRAALVVAGNHYLADRARAAGAVQVRVLPTVVDAGRYAATDPSALDTTPIRIVWIGSPSTVHYLQVAAPALAVVARAHAIEGIVVGAQIQLPGVKLRCLPWTEDTEAAHLRAAHVGIMPLRDTPWERGKCGYKLVQYMASALPVIATGLPANRAIVEDGVQGFIADSSDDWVRALTALVGDASLRSRMGHAGRERVERNYSLQVTAPRLLEWLRELLL